MFQVDARSVKAVSQKQEVDQDATRFAEDEVQSEELFESLHEHLCEDHFTDARSAKEEEHAEDTCK